MLTSACLRTALAGRGVAAQSARAVCRPMSSAAHGHGHDAHAAHGHGHDAHAAHDSHGHDAHGHDGSAGVAKYNNTKAYFLGNKDGFKLEYWMPYHVFFLVGTAAWIYFQSFKPNTRARDWARDEAEERLRRKAEGKDVQYGVNYAALRYMTQEGGITGEQAALLESGVVVEPPPTPINKFRRD